MDGFNGDCNATRSSLHSFGEWKCHEVDAFDLQILHHNFCQMHNPRFNCNRPVDQNQWTTLTFSEWEINKIAHQACLKIMELAPADLHSGEHSHQWKD